MRVGGAHLQWMTMGPASGGCVALTRRMKMSSGLGLSGTPWSGHAVNWNWRTSRFSAGPTCYSNSNRVIDVCLSVPSIDSSSGVGWWPTP